MAGNISASPTFDLEPSKLGASPDYKQITLPTLTF